MQDVLLSERRKPTEESTGHEPETEPLCCPDEALDPARGVLVGLALGLALDAAIAVTVLFAWRQLA